MPELKDRRMTPERLGSFAARHKVKIDDFGAHSNRWVWRFKRGSEGEEHMGMSLPYASLADMEVWADQLMASREPDFIIGDNYLRRWWVIPRNREVNVYLHEINKSDDDRAFHDHPWANTSYLIRGSYIEHTPEGSFVREAGQTIERPATALHRLECVDNARVISLFMTGPIVREWGFDCPQGWRHWTEYTKVGRPPERRRARLRRMKVLVAGGLTFQDRDWLFAGLDLLHARRRSPRSSRAGHRR
jgi:hypothetical protein